MSKITAYASLASTQPDDVLPIVDVHDTTMAPSGTTKKITVANLLGGLLTRVAVQTANYTAAAGQIVPCDTTSASFTVTLPNAPAAGTIVAVKQVTLGTGHAATVACAGSDVFNKSGGGTTGTLTLLAQGMLLHYNGAGIWTVLADDLPLSQLDGRYLPKGATITVPAPTGATAADTPAVTAAIASLVAALASGPCTLLFQDGTYQVDSNALVIRSPNTTTVASASNGAQPSTWVPGSAGTLTVASATGFPSSGKLWLAASGSTVALISYTGTTGTTFTGCLYLSGSATGTLSTGGAVTGCLSDFAVRGTGSTVIAQAPNRAGLVNNVTGDLFVIADCTDFRVEGITLDGLRDTVSPMTPLTAAASSAQPSVTVASGQGSRYLAGQFLYLFGGLGTAEQNQAEGFGVGSGTPLIVSSVTPGGGSGGGDLITFTTNLASSYAQVSSTAFSDPFGPYAYAGAYLTPYQCGASNSVAGRTLSGEDQQCGLHLMNCQRFVISRCTARNTWESPVKIGTGERSGTASLGDACSQGTVTGCVTYHGYDQGISVWLSSQIAVSGCTANSTGWAGVSLTGSNECTVTGNVISNCTYRAPLDVANGNGLVIEGGRGNQVTGNTVIAPYNDGINVKLSPVWFGLTSGTYPTTSTFLEAGTAAGTSVQLSSSAALLAGGKYSVIDGPRTEAVTVTTVVDGTHVTFSEALGFSHASGVSLARRVAQENVISGNTVLNPVAGNGIQCQSAVRNTFSGNIIKGWPSTGIGVQLTFSSGSLPVVLAGAGNVLDGNIIGGGSSQGIMANGATDLLVTGNRLYATGANEAISLKGVTDSAVSDNYISNGLNQGILMQNGGSPSVPCARLEIAGNVVKRMGAQGIEVLNGDSLTVSGNVVSSCTGSGGAAGIDLRGVTRSVIDGNISNSNSNAGIKLQDNGGNFCLYNRVTQNTCRDDGTGFNVTTGASFTQQHGIVEAGTSNSNLITGNECDSNAADQLTTVGASTLAYANNLSGVLSPSAIGLFGDGSDGAATLDGTATVSWASKSGSTYTMTRDCFCTNLTVNSGVTLVPAGFRIFCAGIFSNAGTVSGPGNAASGITGGLATASGTIQGGLNGVNGGTGAGAAGNIGAGSAGTGAGGAGGTGSSGAGGGTRSPRFGSAFPFRLPATAISGLLDANNSANSSAPCGGCAGSAGGGDGVNSGGGGAGGGAIIIIFAWSAVNTGTISVPGGAGGTPPAGNCGGGGSGGGGNIIVYTLTGWTAGTTSVAAGTAGTGVGTGTAGSAGTAGTVLNVIVQ